jgi:hypothetical protein
MNFVEIDRVKVIPHLKSVNKLLPVLSIFFFRYGQNLVQKMSTMKRLKTINTTVFSPLIIQKHNGMSNFEVLHKLYTVIVILAKIGAVKIMVKLEV